MSAKLDELLPQLYESARGDPPPPHGVYERLELVSRVLRSAPHVDAGRRIVWLAEGGVAASRELGSGTLVIGRDDSCDLVLPGTRVSRRHGAIHSSSTGDEIADLASTNGTFVNGVRVARRLLMDGDVIEIGGNPLVYVWRESHRPHGGFDLW